MNSSESNVTQCWPKKRRKFKTDYVITDNSFMLKVIFISLSFSYFGHESILIIFCFCNFVLLC